MSWDPDSWVHAALNVDVGSIVSEAKSAASSAVDTVSNVASAAVDKVTAVASSAASEVKATVNAAAKSVASTAAAVEKEVTTDVKKAVATGAKVVSTVASAQAKAATAAASAAESAASTAWKGAKVVGGAIAGEAKDIYQGMKDNAKLVQEGEGYVDKGIDWLEDKAKSGTKWAADQAKDIPVVGLVAKGVEQTVDTSIDFTGGVLKGATGLVGGVVGVVADPVDTVRALNTMASHIPVVGLPGKILNEAYDVATSDKTLEQAAKEVADPMDDAKYWGNVGKGLWDPIQKSIDDGKPMEGVGQAAAQIGSLFIGAGEVGAAGKLAEVAGTAGKIADVTEAAEVAKAAELAKAAEAAKAAELAKAAEAAKAADAAKAAEAAKAADASKAADAAGASQAADAAGASQAGGAAGASQAGGAADASQAGGAAGASQAGGAADASKAGGAADASKAGGAAGGSQAGGAADASKAADAADAAADSKRVQVPQHPNVNPYEPTLNPKGPTELPPDFSENPRIPPAPKLPTIPEPPPGGFPKPPMPAPTSAAEIEGTAAGKVETAAAPAEASAPGELETSGGGSSGGAQGPGGGGNSGGGRTPPDIDRMIDEVQAGRNQRLRAQTPYAENRVAALKEEIESGIRSPDTEMLAQDRGANVPVEIADGETTLGEAQVNVHHKTSLAEAPELAAKEENLELLDAQGRGSAHASGAHGNRFAEQRGGLAADPNFDENLGMSADKRRVVDSQTGRTVPGPGESPEKNLTLEEEGNITARPKEQSLKDILEEQATSPEDEMIERIDSSSELNDEFGGSAGESHSRMTDAAEGIGTEEEEAAARTETEETKTQEKETVQSEDEYDDSDPSQRTARKLKRQMEIEDNLSEKAKKLDREPRNKKISDSYNKKELEDSGWLKKQERDPDRRRDFMDWLEKKHASGEPHEHLNPGSPEAERALQDWRDEEGGNPIPQ